MKKIIVIASLIVVFFSISLAVAKHFWRGKLMSRENVCKAWPEVTFDSKKFRSAEESTRALMTCSLLKNQMKFIGKDRSEIRRELGDFDGFYFSDMFPAYIIQSADSKNQDSWQIVFLLDRNEKVSEIVVHKNCCD